MSARRPYPDTEVPPRGEGSAQQDPVLQPGAVDDGDQPFPSTMQRRDMKIKADAQDAGPLTLEPAAEFDADVT